MRYIRKEGASIGEIIGLIVFLLITPFGWVGIIMLGYAISLVIEALK